jgi:CheY-like chemotaxis protein
MNLPKYDGIEVLQTIRASADLRHLLVFVFSSAPAHVSEDLMNKAQVKADFYFEKPNEVSSFYSIAAKIRDTYRSAGSTRRL